MPVGIDAESERLIGLGVICSERTTIVTQERGTMRSTNVETHIGRIPPVETMAVDTTLELCVLNQRTLVERGQVAFIDAHFAPNLVARLDETIAEPIVDAVGTDEDVEGTIGVPAVFIFGRNGDAERVTAILSEQGVPVVQIEVD